MSGEAASGPGAALTIVSWNVKGAQGSSRWSEVEAELARLGADVALLQEADPTRLPEGSVCRRAGISGRDGKVRDWGTAVVPLNEAVRLTAIISAEATWHGKQQGAAPLACVDSGAAAAAHASTPVGDMTLVSLYGLMEFGYASGTVLRAIADLEPLIDSAEVATGLLLAGDWNIGTWWTGSDEKYARREGAVLSLLSAYGFVDLLDAHLDPGRGRLVNCRCELGDECRHVWTFRKDSKNVAYQDDYAFATQPLAGRIIGATTAPGWDWDSAVSDHAPLVMRVQVPPVSTDQERPKGR